MERQGRKRGETGPRQQEASILVPQPVSHLCQDASMPVTSLRGPSLTLAAFWVGGWGVETTTSNSAPKTHEQQTLYPAHSLGLGPLQVQNQCRAKSREKRDSGSPGQGHERRRREWRQPDTRNTPPAGVMMLIMPTV